MSLTFRPKEKPRLRSHLSLPIFYSFELGAPLLLVRPSFHYNTVLSQWAPPCLHSLDCCITVLHISSDLEQDSHICRYSSFFFKLPHNCWPSRAQHRESPSHTQHNVQSFLSSHLFRVLNLLYHHWYWSKVSFVRDSVACIRRHDGENSVQGTFGTQIGPTDDNGGSRCMTCTVVGSSSKSNWKRLWHSRSLVVNSFSNSKREIGSLFADISIKTDSWTKGSVEAGKKKWRSRLQS